jgi:hypothetical protein
MKNFIKTNRRKIQNAILLLLLILPFTLYWALQIDLDLLAVIVLVVISICTGLIIWVG